MRTLYTTADQQVYELSLEGAEIGADEGIYHCINVEWGNRLGLGAREYEAIKRLKELQVYVSASTESHTRLQEARRSLPKPAPLRPTTEHPGLLLYAPSEGLRGITPARQEDLPLIN